MPRPKFAPLTQVQAQEAGRRCEEFAKEGKGLKPIEIELVLDGRIEGLRLEPGDIIILRYDDTLPECAVSGLKKFLSAAFPAHENLVLHGGLEIGVIRLSNATGMREGKIKKGGINEGDSGERPPMGIPGQGCGTSIVAG